jgi:hypothetical protein
MPSVTDLELGENWLTPENVRIESAAFLAQMPGQGLSLAAPPSRSPAHGHVLAALGRVEVRKVDRH